MLCSHFCSCSSALCSTPAQLASLQRLPSSMHHQRCIASSGAHSGHRSHAPLLARVHALRQRPSPAPPGSAASAALALRPCARLLALRSSCRATRPAHARCRQPRTTPHAWAIASPLAHCPWVRPRRRVPGPAPSRCRLESLIRVRAEPPPAPAAVRSGRLPAPLGLTPRWLARPLVEPRAPPGAHLRTRAPVRCRLRPAPPSAARRPRRFLCRLC
jgi:hypothetical protein